MSKEFYFFQYEVRPEQLVLIQCVLKETCTLAPCHEVKKI